MKQNIRRELAKSNYLDPKSSSFLNRKKSMVKAGYSENYAEVFGGKVLDNIKLTDTDLANFQSFVQDLPGLIGLCRQKMEQLAQSDNISAKDYSAVLRHIELIAKFAGVMKQTIEKREMVVNVTVPVSRCPKCGYEMDIMKREYERKKERIEGT